jgi:hypothetical protein
MAWDYRRRYGLQVCILRAGFVYGPHDRRNLPQLVDAIRGGSFIYIGSRRNCVPWIAWKIATVAVRMQRQASGADGSASGGVCTLQWDQGWCRKRVQRLNCYVL